MINFIVPDRGSDTVGLVRYLFGPGRANEHTGQRVIAAADTLTITDGTRLEWRKDTAEIHRLGREMDQHRHMLGVEPAGGWVWHCAVSLPPEEQLTDAQWAQVARTAMDRLGFTEASGKAPCRWLAVHHGPSTQGNDHIHLMVNLVREDGTMASTWMDRRITSRLCADMEHTFGLALVPGRAGRGKPGYSRAEIERARRERRAEPERATLERAVRGCAAAARTEADFVLRMRACGLNVRARYAHTDHHRVIGYSVAAPATAARTSVRFGGGRLAADLTLPRLRAYWRHDPQTAQDALTAWSGRGDPAPAPAFGDDIWRQATEVVAGVRDRIAAIAAQDRAAWAGVARETAGVLAAWSIRAEGDQPGPLAHAADVLARSARTEPGQPLPRRDQAVKDLRGVAMVVATEAGDEAGPRLLLRQVTRLMQAVHDAHLACGETRQAQALAAAAGGPLRDLHTPDPATSYHDPYPHLPPGHGLTGRDGAELER